MNLYIDVSSPAVEQAGALASLYGLEHHGLTNLRRVYWNLPAPALYEEAVHRSEGQLCHHGPFVVEHRQAHRARRRRQVRGARGRRPRSDVWWGQYNRPFNPESFSALHARLCGYLQGRDVFVQDVYGGADPEHRLRGPHRHPEGLAQPVRAHDVPEEPTLERVRGATCPTSRSSPRPGFQASPMADGTRSETFIVLNFRQKLAIIGGTGYAGEIKKTVFTVLNYLLPLEGVLSMHCSANVGEDGDAAIFFGLSGTGKTTLSADPARRLVGDDEHGWGAERRLQLRGRLLRQGDPALAGGRAADLRHHAPLRDDPRERGLRPRLAPPRPQRREAHREHPRRLPARLHRERGARQARGPPEERRLPDLRRVGRHAAHRAPRRRSRRSTTSSRATRARSRAPRSASASSRRSPSAPASAGRSWSTTPTSTPTCCGRRCCSTARPAGSSTRAGPAGPSASASASASATPASS